MDLKIAQFCSEMFPTFSNLFPTFSETFPKPFQPENTGLEGHKKQKKHITFAVPKSNFRPRKYMFKNIISMNPMVRAPKGQVFEKSLDEFVNVTKSDEVASLINRIRQTEDKEERRRLKGQLPFRCPHYFRFANDHRSQDSILPEEFTFQTCVDIDDASQVEKALACAYNLDKEEGGKWQGMLLHAEYSASKKLHLDIRIPVGMTIEEAQMAYTQALGVDFDADCCSPERMIYITDEASQLYTSDQWQVRLSDEEIALRRKAYEERGLGIDGRRINDNQNENVNQNENDNVNQNESYPDEYEKIPYTMIVEVLVQLMGGEPAHGCRNRFLLALARQLRHVCNDDPKWIRKIMPDFGENHDRVTKTIESACKLNQLPIMSKLMEDTLRLCRQRLGLEEKKDSKNALMHEPQMPTRLPAPIRIAISKVPDHCRPAMAQAIFPSWAVRMGGVKVEYADNTEMECTLMNVLVAPMATGKSCIKKPIDICLKDIMARDNESRVKEQQWKDAQNSKSANKRGDERPKDICVQVVDSDMTNAAFTQRLADAERAGNKCLYTRMDEIEMLGKLAGGNSKESVSRIICRNFDTDMYGQERVGAQSITARTHIRLCYNASTTPAGAQKYFKNNVNDGTVSRQDFCTIPKIEDDGDIPVYKRYDERYEMQLKPYLQLLDAAEGLIVCQQAKKMARDLCKLAVDRAILCDDEGYRIMARRAAVIAFRKACILYVMNGYKWSREIEDFCRWGFDYDMWVKMSLFSKSLGEDLDKEKKVIQGGSPNMLDMLQETFSRDDVYNLRVIMGKKDANPKDQIAQWKKRGFIVWDEYIQKYRKTQKYLLSHAA